MRATGRWTTCCAWRRSCRVRSTTPPPTCSTSRSTCCFFDTTSTYFELDEGDGLAWRDERGRRVDEADAAAARRAGFRTYRKSKDGRDDLPQLVVGMAVTRTGIPVRVWCWPGNTNDSALIRQVKTEMRDWSLSRIVWVADRGFAAAIVGSFASRRTVEISTCSSSKGSRLSW